MPDFEISKHSGADGRPRTRRGRPATDDERNQSAMPTRSSDKPKQGSRPALQPGNQTTELTTGPPAHHDQRKKTMPRRPRQRQRAGPATLQTTPRPLTPRTERQQKQPALDPRCPPEEEEPSKRATQRHHPRLRSRPPRHCQRAPPQLCNLAKGKRCVIQRMVNGR